MGYGQCEFLVLFISGVMHVPNTKMPLGEPGGFDVLMHNPSISYAAVKPLMEECFDTTRPQIGQKRNQSC